MLPIDTKLEATDSWILVSLYSGIAFLIQGIRFAITRDWPSIGPDPALFQHAGWYVTQGARMYIDIWDPKPPAVIETTAILSILSGGDVYIHHSLSIFATICAMVTSAVLITLIVQEMTEEYLSGILSGIVFISFPFVLINPFHGFGVKAFTVMFGLLSIYAAKSNKPALAGGSAVLSAAYWQFSLIFVLIAFLILPQRRLRRFVAGGIVTGGIIMAPIIYWGAVIPMVVETIIAPASGGEVQSFLYRLVKGVLALSWSIPLCVIGVLGIFSHIRKRSEDWDWLLLFIMWFSLQIFVLDYDGSDDLMYGFVLVAIGVGLLYDYELKSYPKRGLRGFVLALVLFNTLTLGGVGIVDHSEIHGDDDDSALLPKFVLWTAHHAGYEEYQLGGSSPADLYEVESPYGPEKVKELFWNKTIPTSCHYRLSGLELAWINETSDTYIQESCGTLPNKYIIY